MDAKYNIGIYIKENLATIIALNCQGRERKVIDCFSVGLEQADTPDSEKSSRLVGRLLKMCSERKISFSDTEINIAIDCSMYMQHSIKSAFSDAKQIEKTIRFDTEEAFANDISGFALAYTITSKDGKGSNVSVFTAEKKLLNDILTALQNHNIDPVTIQPDVICLSRFVFAEFPSARNTLNIFAVLSADAGYLLTSSTSPDKTSIARTFFISPGQDRSSLVKNQITMTSALLNDNLSAASVKIFDTNDSIDPAHISSKWAAESVDLRSFFDFEQIPQPNRPDPVAFAICYGAAIPAAEKADTVDFRKDFNIYQGKKIRILKTAKIISICASIFFLALGIFYQQKLISANSPRKQDRAQFDQYYLEIVTEADEVPKKLTEAIRKLKVERSRLQNYNQGRLDEQGTKTIPAKLTLLLKAFNQCANETALQVDSINVTSKNIIVNGSTSSKQNFIRLRDAIKETGIEIKQDDDLGFKNSRQNFKLTLVI